VSKEKEESIIDEIWVTKFDEESAQHFRRQVLTFARMDPTAIIPIYIDSYGGFVDSLAKMLETMDEVPNRFVTVCMGKAISCGAMLLSHGDLRFCGPLSRVMVHNISVGSWGDAYALRADSDEALRMNRKFMGLLAQNCGTTYEQLQHTIKESVGSKEIWMDAEAALKFNIVDKVGIPVMSASISWSFEIPDPKPRVDRKIVKKSVSKKVKKVKKSR